MNNFLSLEFKDTNSPITFDLNQNTLFFGNNGRGKTRVLKTIASLYKLAHQQDLKEMSELIDDMYLKELKIGEIDCKNLFVNNENIKNENLKSLRVFTRVYIEEFRNIYKELSFFRNYITHSNNLNNFTYYQFAEILGFFDKNVLSILKDICERKIAINKYFKNLRDFEFFLKNLEIVLRKFEDLFKIEIRHNNFEEINKIDLDSALYSFNIIKANYRKDFSMNSSDNFKREREDISKIKKQIIEYLTSKSAYYITTDNLDIQHTLENIKTVALNLNRDVQDWFWSKKDDKNPVRLMKEKEHFISKLTNFNEIMRKYGLIQISYHNNEGIRFEKEGREITFEKFSSGERKITFLFLEILFNEADIYLIDEPEISVSLNFQNKIVIDLHNLTKNKKLFIATHAPFIYEDFKNIDGNIVKEVN